MIVDGSIAFDIAYNGVTAVLTYGSTTVTLIGAAGEFDSNDVFYIEEPDYPL
ncbi:hypothetical protein [Sagittula sp. SSi028]|uniref:hypothetical protein n=1 Tax=Sagittula sp. SSi028 TaxID=3400636 RepID=UPI003AF76261